jgi:hypothetical protein
MVQLCVVVAEGLWTTVEKEELRDEVVILTQQTVGWSVRRTVTTHWSGPGPTAGCHLDLDRPQPLVQRQASGFGCFRDTLLVHLSWGLSRPVPGPPGRYLAPPQ